MSSKIPNTIAALITLAVVNAPAINQASAATATAILAGGCFWCIEKDFEKVTGVKDVISGYTGGKTTKPGYKTYIKGGHREAVKITYDPDKISYEKLLYIFWRTVDPTDGGGQFCDRGVAYSTAIYPTTKQQFKTARTSKAELQKSLGGK